MVREATKEEKDLFISWMGDRDTLGFTQLLLKPFKLLISSQPLHCTLKHIGDTYTIECKDLERYRAEHNS